MRLELKSLKDSELRISRSLGYTYAVADTDILAVKSGLRKALEAQDVDRIVEQFKIIYSSVPYVHFDLQQQVYIFELKTAAPQKAIEQIIEKNYAGAYGNYQVTLVGLQIDFAERNIVSHQSTPGLELK